MNLVWSALLGGLALFYDVLAVAYGCVAVNPQNAWRKRRWNAAFAGLCGGIALVAVIFLVQVWVR